MIDGCHHGNNTGNAAIHNRRKLLTARLTHILKETCDWKRMATVENEIIRRHADNNKKEEEPPAYSEIPGSTEAGYYRPVTAFQQKSFECKLQLRSLT